MCDEALLQFMLAVMKGFCYMVAVSGLCKIVLEMLQLWEHVFREGLRHPSTKGSQLLTDAA